MSDITERDASDLTLTDVDNIRNLALDLFQNTGDLPAKRATNSLGMYDICPKYCRQGNLPYWTDDPSESTRIANFKFKGQFYIVEVEAAKIVEKDNSIRYYFPSTNEELVEDVLRHLMTINRQESFFQDNYGCQFSLYFIYNELKEYNKTRNKGEIRQSLRILSKARLSIYLEKHYDRGRGEPIFSGPLFSEASVIDLDDYYTRSINKNEDRIKGKVKFHNMVSEGIKQIDFRLIRYDICMSYKNDMSRWLHKRISHMHTGADLNTPFTIKLTTVINDGNWSWQSRNNKNKAKAQAALKEMIKKDMVNGELTKIDPILSDDGSKYSDYMLTIFLSKTFVDHIIMSNTLQSQNKTAITKTSDVKLFSSDSVKDLFEKLISVGSTDADARQWLIEYGEQNVKAAILYTQKAQETAFRKQKQFHFVPYLKKCIELQWAKSLVEPSLNLENLPLKEPDIEIDISKYSGLKKNFVIEHVLNSSPNAKMAFIKYDVVSGHFRDEWESYMRTHKDLLTQD